MDRGFNADEDEVTCTKIYYASRTHSQLSQVLPELRRLHLHPIATSFSSAPSSGNKRTLETMNDESVVCYTRAVSLGSRKQLCINEDLRARKKDLDEGCRELLDGVFMIDLTSVELTA